MTSSGSGNVLTAFAGRFFGRYEIIAPIGRGGMGEVYRARDTQLHREVALKILRCDSPREPDRVRRFEDEARALSQANHANVVAIYDVGREGQTPYLVTEFVDGQTLRAILAKGPVDISRALKYAVQIAYGLAAAHERGIIHRDLKPANIVITRHDEVKILDFGLAKLGHPEWDPRDLRDSTVTAPGLVVGTIAYMAPEQLEGSAVDARSDIFAFGVVLYEMITGTRPFTGASFASVAAAILRGEPRQFSGNARAVPGPLRAILRRCLEKSADARFQSARDLAFALEREQLAVPVPGVATLRWFLTRRLAVLSAGGVAAIAASLFAFRDAPMVKTTQQPAAVSIREVTRGVRTTGFAMSPDKRFVAYGAPGAEQQEILLKHLATDNELAILSERGAHTVSVRAFSPDGNYIFYRRSDGEGIAIKRISVVGGEPVTIAERRSISASFGVSPDGSRIAYATRDERQAGDIAHHLVYVAAADGTGETLLARIPREQREAIWDLAWAPDGKTIVATVSYPLGFAVAASPDATFGPPVPPSALLTIDTATGAVRRIALPESHRPLAVSWTRDGRGLLTTGHTSELMFVSWPGGRHELLNGISVPLMVTRVVDDSTLIGVTANEEINVWTLDTATQTANRVTYAVNTADGRSGLARLADGRVVFTVQSGPMDIALWTSRSDGNVRRALTHPPPGATHEHVTVSPDGEILYLSRSATPAGATSPAT